VEWTPKGATAVRDKSYLYISPTYTAHYKDQHRIDRGRALLGAACANRPVLRALPTLSLSRDSFDGVAVPRQAKKRNSRKATPARIQARGAVSARGCSTGHGRPASRGSYQRASTFVTPWPIERARWSLVARTHDTISVRELRLLACANTSPLARPAVRRRCPWCSVAGCKTHDR
jgi:hypothetical protein